MAERTFLRFFLRILLCMTAMAVAFLTGRASLSPLLPQATRQTQLDGFNAIQRTTLARQRRQIEQLEAEKAAVEAVLQRLQVRQSPTIDRWLEAEAAFRPRVTGVTDGGDTLEVQIGEKTERVRLEGIDCPESDQPFGDRALAFTTELCFGNEVELVEKGRDESGTALAEVTVGNVKVNRELLRKGLAWHDKQQNHDPDLAQLENEAREDKVGLWSEERPIPPWEWWQR